MSGRIFVENDEIEELISKSRLQNDERPNIKDTRPMREGLRLLNSNHLTKFGIFKEINDEISVTGYCLTSSLKTKKPHRILIYKNLINGHLQPSCKCEAGSNHCKHMVGLCY